MRSWRDAPFAAALLAGRTAEARVLYDAQQVIHVDGGVGFEGVLRPEAERPIAHAELLGRIQSWEMLDRLYEPVEPERAASVRDQAVRAFLDATALALDWAVDHVFTTPDGWLIGVAPRAWERLGRAWAGHHGFVTPARWRDGLDPALLEHQHAARRLLEERST